MQSSIRFGPPSVLTWFLCPLTNVCPSIKSLHLYPFLFINSYFELPPLLLPARAVGNRQQFNENLTATVKGPILFLAFAFRNATFRPSTVYVNATNRHTGTALTWPVARRFRFTLGLVLRFDQKNQIRWYSKQWHHQVLRYRIELKDKWLLGDFLTMLALSSRRADTFSTQN